MAIDKGGGGLGFSPTQRGTVPEAIEDSEELLFMSSRLGNRSSGPMAVGSGVVSDPFL